MTQGIPNIRIKYGWLLASITSEAMQEKYSRGEALGNYSELTDIAMKYDQWWQPYSERILRGICDILDLQFTQNVIDIYVSPWFNPISDPMVIGPAFDSEDILINTIAHELIHRLITDNTAIDYEHDFISDWKKLFGDSHDWNTLVHIPVHATMKVLYIDVLNRPDLFKLDIEEVKDNKPYVDAWTYVNKHNYKDIVASLSVSKST